MAGRRAVSSGSEDRDKRTVASSDQGTAGSTTASVVGVLFIVATLAAVVSQVVLADLLDDPADLATIAANGMVLAVWLIVRGLSPTAVESAA
jgi:hypothetical protein